MRRLFLLAGLLALVPLASCRDAEAVELDAMRVTLFADSIHVTVPLAVPVGADSARITLTVTPGGSFTRSASAQAVSVTFATLAPAEGATNTLKACGIAYKKGVAGPNSCNSQQSWTRPVTAPGPVTWPDSMVISALRDSRLVDTALIALTTGEVCPAEIRDYHRAMLIAPRSGTPQSDHCVTVFETDVAQDNARTLTALAAGYPWTARQDSLWRADTTVYPTLPLVRVSTRWFPNPMSGDTFVFGAGADNNVPIATYRARHPGWTWSGT
jgi:hypothetical protein